MPDLTLTTSVGKIAGVGPARVEQLAAAGVYNLGDLLNYFPRDYQYVSEQATIADLQANTVATTVGEIIAVDYIPGPRARFEATLDDGTGKLSLTFFNSAFLRSRIHPGMTLKVKGKLRFFREMPQMQNPKWGVVESDEKLDEMNERAGRKAPATLLAVYPASGKLTSDVLGRLIAGVLDEASALLPETLPAGILSRRELLGRGEAYRMIHRPRSKDDAIAGRKRLVYDELMTLQLGLLLSKRAGSRAIAAPMLRCDRTLDARIRARFPYPLTEDQTHATYDILKDVGSGQPMNRLLQGDVGSGKTAVAVYAMLVAVANKMQAALLAPTEVLAEQHAITLGNLLGSSQVCIELFTSRTKRESKGGLTRALADGRVHIAVGTQALLQEDIGFANLGLIVIDEQHRLGVQQRATLRTKGLSPHYLVMTATPIPRTLALSYFADFDVSTIEHLPPGRVPIQTQLLAGKEGARAWPFVRSEVSAGRQAYVIVPLIGEDDSPAAAPLFDAGAPGPDALPAPAPSAGTASLLQEFDRLSAGPLKGLRLALLHGRMDAEQKKKVMTAFRAGEHDVLLATTVIEVGIDVPNATTIVIEDADKFGLSQLHQLRGRVGRGTHASTCLLLTGSPDDNALSRLKALTQTANGFEIAELDLQLRGPGQFFGTRQHGLPEFRLADLSSETHLLHEAREDAQLMLANDPKLGAPELRALRAEITAQFADALPLASVG